MQLGVYVDARTAEVRRLGSDGPLDPAYLERLADAVESLPLRVNLPRLKGGCRLLTPTRFVVLAEGEGEGVAVREIVGVKADMSATKWSYALGYWHPVCQASLARALRRAAARLRSAQR